MPTCQKLDTRDKVFFNTGHGGKERTGREIEEVIPSLQKKKTSKRHRMKSKTLRERLPELPLPQRERKRATKDSFFPYK